jgi:hypothetical protein
MIRTHTLSSASSALSDVPFFGTPVVLTMDDLDRDAQRIAAQDDRWTLTESEARARYVRFAQAVAL